MLQRSQTLHLLLGAALLVLFVVTGHTWAISIAANVSWLGPVAYGLAALTAVVALGAVFLYKDRKRQRSVIGMALWLDLALVFAVLVGLFVTTPPNDVNAAGSVDAIGLYGRYLVALVPLVAYVLLRMARRGVDRDIATVRSMDRIR